MKKGIFNALLVLSALLIPLTLQRSATAANRWKPVNSGSAAKVGSMLLARLDVRGRSYTLYRDMQTQGYLFSINGRKENIADSMARTIRSDIVNLAWKIEYQAKLARKPRVGCQKIAAVLIVPATDDLVRICSEERSYLRETRNLVARIDKVIIRKLARQ